MADLVYKDKEDYYTYKGEMEKRPLSEGEMEKFSKLKEMVETSHQQILRFQPFL